MSLFDWARSAGCEWPSRVEFRRDEERGVHCVCTEDCDSAVIRIPVDVVIRGTLAREYFKLTDEEHVYQNSWMKLLFSRMKYGGEGVIVNGEDLSKKFGGYISELPQLVNSPLLWTPQEVSRLLAGTNLGNSVYEKLNSVLNEWKTVIRTRPEFVNDITNPFLSVNYDDLDDNQMYQLLVEPLTSGSELHWLSFPAFLYSHLIFTSRAFPEYVVNPNCEQTSVVLLPVIDLLNHDYNAKVEWYPEEIDGTTYFCYKSLDNVSKECELFNNYGGKGNEELLMGYGFVLEENIFDAVALRIKLPVDTITDIINNHPDVELPTMDKYTTFAFDLAKVGDEMKKETPSAKDFKDGVMYFVNNTNASVLDSLIDLFSYMKLYKNENITDLRPRLDGIQMLKVAFKQKLDTALQNTPDSIDQNSYKDRCSLLYRNSQISILKNVITNLKRIEKELFRENKKSLLSMDKVMKNDPGFTSEELPSLFEGQDGDDIVFDSSLDLFVLWVILKMENKSFVEKYRDIEIDLAKFVKAYNHTNTSEEAKGFKDHLLPQSSQISIATVTIAIDYVKSHIVTRLNSKCEEDDTIFVRK
ncbi:protein-lysine N-methyltransferase [Nakaseomyces bracarensis]|uniref:protein-lysine N-methyltransferase n=1 Tax=Nakaseomyces bracarensis TaxID=273131 RepID=UPI00387176A5